MESFPHSWDLLVSCPGFEHQDWFSVNFYGHRFPWLAGIFIPPSSDLAFGPLGNPELQTVFLEILSISEFLCPFLDK